MRQRLDIPKGMKEIEALVAIGLYKTRTENIRQSLRDLFAKQDVKPIYEVREHLDRYVKRGLSEEIRKVREEEMH